jgi:xanthine dehydrogenase accessory factor
MNGEDVFKELEDLRAAGNACCLATVVRVEAPTSCKPGDKAVITPEGRMIGWVGGSCTSGTIRREAMEALETGASRLVRIEPETEEPSTPRGGEVVFPTTCPSGGTIEIFLEPYLARPQLVVIGQSPASHTLLRLASVLEFRTCLVHPGAARDDFPNADLVLGNLELGRADIGTDSWVVVATMGHYDEEALEAALVTNAAYVGLVASKRRRQAVVEALRRRGWSGDALAGIVNPAGRELGDSQADIALFVLAEVVDRRQRRVRRERASEPAPAETPTYAHDPVCGMSVEIATAKYRSGDVYFCAAGCRDAYEAHPEQFAHSS